MAKKAAKKRPAKATPRKRTARAVAKKTTAKPAKKGAPKARPKKAKPAARKKAPARKPAPTPARKRRAPRPRPAPPVEEKPVRAPEPAPSFAEPPEPTPGETPAPPPLREPRELPPHLTQQVEKAWPERIIDFMKLDFDRSYLAPIVDPVRAALLQVEPACAFYEKKPALSSWMSDDATDLPTEGEFPRSYHLFFVGPLGDQFEGPCETVEETPEGTLNTIRGKYRWGWTVALSYVAPVAVLVSDTVSEYANGSLDYLELNLVYGDEQSPEHQSTQDRLAADAWQKLATMRERIVALLNQHGIQALPREALGAPLKQFQTAENTLVDSDELLVKDAFFFRSI